MKTIRNITMLLALGMFAMNICGQGTTTPHTTDGMGTTGVTGTTGHIVPPDNPPVREKEPVKPKADTSKQKPPKSKSQSEKR